MTSPTFTAPLDRQVDDLCRREWPRRISHMEAGQHGVSLTIDQLSERVCPLRSLLPELVALMEQHPHQPASALELTVRRFIAERAFLDEGGDPCIEGDQAPLVDAYVDLLVYALERVRCEQIDRGECAAPVTPQMFG